MSTHTQKKNVYCETLILLPHICDSIKCPHHAGGFFLFYFSYCIGSMKIIKAYLWDCNANIDVECVIKVAVIAYRPSTPKQN